MFADEASQWAGHERADESETSARLESSALPDESESTELRDLVADMTEADVEGLVAVIKNVLGLKMVEVLKLSYIKKMVLEVELKEIFMGKY